MREAARDYRKLTAVPKELAQREAELESRGYQVWLVFDRLWQATMDGVELNYWERHGSRRCCMLGLVLYRMILGQPCPY